MMAQQDILIGIDAGTSVIKTVAFDLSGQQIAVAAVSNRYVTRPDGAAVQDMNDTWEDAALALRQLVEKVPGIANRVAAIGVTGQGDGTWLIDKHGEPVTEAWLWLDARAADRAEKLKQKPCDHARYVSTGAGLNSCQMGTQLGLMREIMPEVFDTATTSLHCKDWLYFRMTGERVVDPSEASFTFGDFRTRNYSPDVIDALELNDLKYLLPPVIDGTQQTHKLTEAAARQTGLRAGTPVALAYVDVTCTAIGGGLFAQDDINACTIIGSTGMHMVAKPAEDFMPVGARSGYVMPLPIPGWVAQIQSNMAATLNLDWVFALAGEMARDFGHQADRAELIARLNGWLTQARPGQLLYHPYISEAGERGPFFDVSARASLIGLNSGHRFPDIVRSVVEGLGLSARHCYSAMGEIPREIVVTGGAARADELRRILGACLGADLRRATREEAGATGAAMIAAVGVGLAPDMRTIIKDWVSPTLSSPEGPDAGLVQKYNQIFPSYTASVAALAPIWKQL